ncbi:MAG: hypothetical protein K5Q00_06035 [Gammaproteobacteria bacterium]|nr:hypothetical protein [Gammaproteobacteria bacterium]
MNISISKVLKDWLERTILSGYPTTLIFRIADDITGCCDGDREAIKFERKKDGKVFSSIFMTREYSDDAVAYADETCLSATEETELDKLVQKILSLLDQSGHHELLSYEKNFYQ